MSDFPEHDRLALVSDQSQAIGEFLDASGFVLAEWTASELIPVPGSINEVLADYFGIDLDKIEAEKRAMLDIIRKDNP